MAVRRPTSLVNPWQPRRKYGSECITFVARYSRQLKEGSPCMDLVEISGSKSRPYMAPSEVGSGARSGVHIIQSSSLLLLRQIHDH